MDAYYFQFNFYSVKRSYNDLRMLFEKFDKDNNETWITPDLERNLSEILPHSTPFLNDKPESLGNPSAYKGRIIQKLFGCTYGSICKVGLKTHHNKYVVAEKKGKANANRDWMRSWEIFSVTFIGVDKVQFKGHHGKYLVAERDGTVNANRPWARSWETWTVENKWTGLAFKSYHGKYLVAESNGKLNANRNNASIWETFRVIPV